MDPAGRRGMALSGDVVAIVWEDNRGGTPSAYAAFLKPGASQFIVQKLSAGESYEVSVAPLKDGQFIFGWEEQGSVRVRTGSADRLGPVHTLSRGEAGQIALDVHDNVIHAAWSERSGRHRTVLYLRVPSSALDSLPAPVAVAPGPKDDQLFPSVVITGNRTWVAWEDRSEGHTRILAAHSGDGKQFGSPQRVNRMRREGRRQIEYGKGPGATRVALTAVNASEVAAVWLDKREFLGGYDVFVAFASEPAAEFGPVATVQDEFGNGYGQWHAGLASDGKGTLIAVWDDDRDGSSDLQLSQRTATGWSANLPVTGANGPGQDTSPVAAFDRRGRLHIAWVERAAVDAPTRLLYLRAEANRAGP